MALHYPDPGQDGDCALACEGLSIAFANAVDRWDDETALGLFTDDAVLDRWGTQVQGQAALREWLAARPRDVVTRHICTNISVKCSSEREATGLTYFLFFRAVGKAGDDLKVNGPTMVGEYHDHFVRTANGWRIARREVKVIFTSA
jgi:predicted RNA-binding Zn ribbon-like protein